MTLTLQPLDYELDALEPVVSARTLRYHYEKHYAGYVAKTVELIKGTEFENMPLAEIIRHTSDKSSRPRQTLFNNAAQAWNHEFFGSAWRLTEAVNRAMPSSARSNMLSAA